MLAMKFSLPDVPYSIAGKLSTKSYPIHSSAIGFTVKRCHKHVVTLLFFLSPRLYIISLHFLHVMFTSAQPTFIPLFSFYYYQIVFYTAAFLKKPFASDRI